MSLNKVFIIVVLLLIGLLIGASIYNSHKTVNENQYTIDSNYPAEATSTDTTSTTTVSSHLETPEDLVIAMGQTATTSADVSITLHKLVQEFRCPVDVKCIQAGGVTVNTTLRVGERLLTRNFPSDEAPFVFEGVAFSIKEIKPDLHAKKTIDPNNYVITFHVEPTTKKNSI